MRWQGKNLSCRMSGLGEPWHAKALQHNDFPANRKWEEQAEYDFTLRFPVRQGKRRLNLTKRPSPGDAPVTHHFGVLIPSTNTTVEIECRLLPTTYQAHIGRLMTSTPSRTFSPSRDEDIDYQSRLLGSAKVELLILAQTSASLFADDYDEVTTRRMSEGAGVPAITSAQAVGRAVRALGARHIAIVSPYSDEVNKRAGRYFAAKHGLEAVALEGFGATDSYAIGQLGPENARNAFARINRPEIEAFVVPGGNFPTVTSIAQWEREFGKPVVTTNQASFWAMLRFFGVSDRIAGFGRLLEEVPAG